MPKKQIQTRRSVTVRGLTHQRIKKYADANGMSVSGFVEAAIEDRLGSLTEEDRRKFGALVEARQRTSEAAKPVQKELDAPQKTLPPPPDPVRKSAPAPTPEPAPPTPTRAAKLPRKAPPEPVPTPEPPTDPRIFRHGARPRKLSQGSPADNLKRPAVEPENQPEGFEDYIPPIFQL